MAQTVHPVRGKWRSKVMRTKRGKMDSCSFDPSCDPFGGVGVFCGGERRQESAKGNIRRWIVLRRRWAGTVYVTLGAPSDTESPLGSGFGPDPDRERVCKQWAYVSCLFPPRISHANGDPAHAQEMAGVKLVRVVRKRFAPVTC